MKSLFIHELSICAALGKPFLNGAFWPTRPLRVVGCQWENTEKLVAARYRMLKLAPEEEDQVEQNLVTFDRVNVLLDDDGVAMAIEMFRTAFPNKDEPPDLLTFDPLRNGFSEENEDNASDMMKFLRSRIEVIRAKVNPVAGVCMAHHTVKRAPEEMARDPFICIRGSGALRAYYDACVVLFARAKRAGCGSSISSLRSAESPKPMEMVLKHGQFVRASAGFTTPMETLRDVLRMIDRRWEEDKPLHLDATLGKRYPASYLPAAAQKHFGVPPDEMLRIAQGWLENDIVVSEPYDRKTKHRSGLRVIGNLD